MAPVRLWLLGGGAGLSLFFSAAGVAVLVAEGGNPDAPGLGGFCMTGAPSRQPMVNRFVELSEERAQHQAAVWDGPLGWLRQPTDMPPLAVHVGVCRGGQGDSRPGRRPHTVLSMASLFLLGGVGDAAHANGPPQRAAGRDHLGC